MERQRMTQDEATKRIVKNEIVDVKPIVRERPFFKKGHDGEFMYTGTHKTYQLPYSNQTRSYVQIFSDSKEQEAFEVYLSLPEGALNVNNRNSEFWLKFTIQVTKEGKQLDLSIPAHVLEYKVLKANVKRIAPDWASRHKPGLEFALVNETQINEDDNKRAAFFEKAMDEFTKIRKSNSKMYNVLRLLDKKIASEYIDRTDFLKTELLKIIEQREKPRGDSSIKTVYDFLKVVEDSRFDTKVLIYDAMDAKEVIMRDGVFKIDVTGSVMGKSIQQAAEWLDDLANQEDKIILQQRIKKD